MNIPRSVVENWVRSLNMAKFREWTRDPGIARFECSDRTMRLIPTFAIKGLIFHPLPKQNMANKVIIGLPSHS